MIGVIDSGIGGISVLREIYSHLPDHSLHYIGDTAWCPYGSKSYEEIISRTRVLTDYLLEQGADLIVLACNSATIAAIEYLRAHYPIPFIGMEPGVKPAAKLTKSNAIGVLATEASLSGEKFLRLVSTHAQNLRVITQPCPRFVELVEAGTLDGPEIDFAIEQYIDPLIEAGVDVLILGCSHYPFLKEALRKRLPQKVQFIDTGEAIARRVEELKPFKDQNASLVIQTTGPQEKFQQLLNLLAPELNSTCSTLHLS